MKFIFCSFVSPNTIIYEYHKKIHFKRYLGGGPSRPVVPRGYYGQMLIEPVARRFYYKTIFCDTDLRGFSRSDNTWVLKHERLMSNRESHHIWVTIDTRHRGISIVKEILVWFLCVLAKPTQ